MTKAKKHLRGDRPILSAVEGGTMAPRTVKKIKYKHRRSFFPTLLLAILFWIAWGWLVYSIAPDKSLSLISFYLLLFMALFLTFALALANSRRGFLIAIGAIGFLIFRYYDLANYLNLTLFLGILICLEIYYIGRKPIR